MTSVNPARPQVGIERIARPSGVDGQRESMNCKSCRKRKIKCNRLRPSCEACRVFQCACIYDAIPRKRGPKTDVLEALLKRVDGLEKRLKDEKKPSSPTNDGALLQAPEASLLSLVSPAQPFPTDQPDVLLDTYFLRVQDKPFHILDEPTIRQQVLLNQIPQYLRLGIYSVGARFANHAAGYAAAVQLSEEYARQARVQMDVDEPSITALQTTLLIHRAFNAAGKGRKAYMLLTTAIGMAMALGLHREVPDNAHLSYPERELRRHLFWTCYLMDRFTACGSKRPSLIADNSISLRLPSWIAHPSSAVVPGELFSAESNLRQGLEPGRLSQGGNGMLIDISRILGITNRYLAVGGVTGDSHFPWHTLSNLSKIRQDLNVWAQGNSAMLGDVSRLVGQPDNCILVMSKMIYHLIHCLIYRPFLPVDLSELRGTGQQQSWQIEATNFCFFHANAIAELAKTAWKAPNMEWPAFTGYTLCTAGTVHVHGIHYESHEGDLYSPSAEYLDQERQQLSELRKTWAGVQHQYETLQNTYKCHVELVRSKASNPRQASPAFNLEDFFDRYHGHVFDGSHVTFTDISPDLILDDSPTHNSDSNELRSSNLLPSPSYMQAHITTGLSTSSASPQALHRRFPSNHSHPSPQSLNLGSGNEMTDLQHVSPQPSTAHLSPTSFPLHATTNHLLPPTNSPFPTAYNFLPIPQKSSPFGASPYGMTSQENSGPDKNMNVFGNIEPMYAPAALAQSDSTLTSESEKDPFLTLLEQLAENERSNGGPSDLDYYLSRQDV